MLVCVWVSRTLEKKDQRGRGLELGQRVLQALDLPLPSRLACLKVLHDEVAGPGLFGSQIPTRKAGDHLERGYPLFHPLFANTIANEPPDAPCVK